MGTIYGIEIREPHNKYYRMVERMGEVAEAATVPGNFPVEAFRVLRYLPSWFPGGGFKTWAADAKRDISLIVDHLFDNAKDAAAAVSYLWPPYRRPGYSRSFRADIRLAVGTAHGWPHFERPGGAGGEGRSAGEDVQGDSGDAVRRYVYLPLALHRR